MRLWHEALIPYLPHQQLLGQHRECCALRGNGWGRRHATVNYVFRHPYWWLCAYHKKVMLEMFYRGYQPGNEWWDFTYRGEKCEPITSLCLKSRIAEAEARANSEYPIYPEHDPAYLRECLENLARKGIKIEMEVKENGKL